MIFRNSIGGRKREKLSLLENAKINKPVSCVSSAVEFVSWLTYELYGGANRHLHHDSESAPVIIGHCATVFASSQCIHLWRVLADILFYTLVRAT